MDRLKRVKVIDINEQNNGIDMFLGQFSSYSLKCFLAFEITLICSFPMALSNLKNINKKHQSNNFFLQAKINKIILYSICHSQMLVQVPSSKHSAILLLLTTLRTLDIKSNYLHLEQKKVCEANFVILVSEHMSYWHKATFMDLIRNELITKSF